ncbi:hypothetical protein FE257_002198 [Aspergillus nanangensis]|uniref:Uncharacterized protein n=1 Tax=Aspergillus nanangensis TaxID=2582783 RepID=A0AAD4CEF3_ASPNN|nr:hypothetical protein FE257_002198 [Aspergillus nanangensis]
MSTVAVTRMTIYNNQATSSGAPRNNFGTRISPSRILSSSPSIPITTVGLGLKKTSSSGGPYAAPITSPPATLSVMGADTTSKLSSLSSEITSLIPVLKANPTSPVLDMNTLDHISHVNNDIEHLISDLGGQPSPLGCGSNNGKGFLYGTVDKLSCMGASLKKITEGIRTNDMDVIDDGLVSSIIFDAPTHVRFGFSGQTSNADPFFYSGHYESKFCTNPASAGGDFKSCTGFDTHPTHITTIFIYKPSPIWSLKRIIANVNYPSIVSNFKTRRNTRL